MDAFICDYIRTPIGRFGGALSSVRADDLGAIPLRALMARNGGVDWDGVDDVIFGCANQAGEDNRNVARMSALLAGLPVGVTGTTINRLCGSGMDAVLTAARAIAAGEADLMIAGGVESMSRAPFVMPKADTAFSRHAEIHDTTIGWRFVNPAMQAAYGTDSMHGAGQPDQGGGGAGERAAGAGNHPGHHCATQGRRAGRGPRRTPARHHDRGAGKAEAAVSQRVGHGGQRLGRE